MKTAELIAKLRTPRNGDDLNLQPAALIMGGSDWRHRGIAILIGENLCTGLWLSDEIIVFWDNGDHTTLEDGNDVLFIKRLM